MLLNFLLSTHFPFAFALRRFLFSFLCFRALAQVFANVARLLVVASLDVTLVLVVVVVNVILLADDDVLFHHAPALTPTVALAVVALFLS